MQWYHEALILMAVFATILAWRVPWAVIIVAVGSIFYAATAFLHNVGFPYGVLMGAISNLIMCTGLAMISNPSRMIDRVFSCYILMILIDLLFVTRVIETQYIFAVSLEVVNAYALLLICITGFVERAGNGRLSRHPDSSLLDYLNRALLGESKAYPRWWKHP